MIIETIKPLMFENTQNYIYRVLKQNIISLSLAPGEGISESDLTAAFSSSRSPVRGALMRLNEEDLVVILPQKKTMVAKLDPEFIIQASFTRSLIETELMLEVIKSGKAQMLATLMKNELSLIEAEMNDHEAGQFLNLLNHDIRLHGYIYQTANREKLLTCLRLPYLHYNRFQSLHLRNQLDDGSFIPHHLALAQLIEAENLDAIVSRRDKNSERVKTVLDKSIAEHPDYFI